MIDQVETSAADIKREVAMSLGRGGGRTGSALARSRQTGIRRQGSARPRCATDAFDACSLSPDLQHASEMRHGCVRHFRLVRKLRIGTHTGGCVQTL